MSRSILISDVAVNDNLALEGTGFAYNTLTFEIIVEGTRAGFLAGEEDCKRRCFESLDCLGMDYLCLWDLDANCFNIFERACVRGLRLLKTTREFIFDFQATPEQVDGAISIWADLITELRRDPRFDGENFTLLDHNI